MLGPVLPPSSTSHTSIKQSKLSRETSKQSGAGALARRGEAEGTAVVQAGEGGRPKSSLSCTCKEIIKTIQYSGGW